MSNGDLISIRLRKNDLRQIIDGLEVLAEDWEQTQRFMKFGEGDTRGIIRECSNDREAGKIARQWRADDAELETNRCWRFVSLCGSHSASCIDTTWKSSNSRSGWAERRARAGMKAGHFANLDPALRVREFPPGATRGLLRGVLVRETASGVDVLLVVGILLRWGCCLCPWLALRAGLVVGV